jgi:UDP-N-acetylmuramoyl-tripeptide--D-alanyl-D-alanine ligase
MSKAGEIAKLVQIVRPHISIITTIAAAHIESFGTLEGVADAKAEIFQGMMPDAIAIVNGDVPQSKQLCRRAKEQDIQTIIQFGEEDHCEARLLEYVAGEDFNIIKAHILGAPIEFKLYPKGKHWAMNAIAALTGVHFAGGDIQKAAEDIAGYRPTTGRGDEISLKHNILVVDESYNANPASMEASIASFFERIVKGRRILVLGSMAELGDLAEAEHANLGKLLETYSVDEIFLCGDEMKFAQKAYDGKATLHFYATLDECISGVLGHVHEGDSVMIKARRSMQLDKVVTALKQHFGTP